MKSIVILGGGFGGVQVARRLGRSLKKHKLTNEYNVILVEQNSFHTFTPTLYDIATTSDSVASNKQLQAIVTFKLEEIFAGLPVQIVRAKASAIDVQAKEVRLEGETRIAFEYLVLALGSQAHFFNIPGLAQYALPLKSFVNALHIRERIIELTDDDEIKQVRIVVGGGGPTGIELAAEIKLLLAQSRRVAEGYCTSVVTVVDGAPSILSQFKPALIRRAEKRLAALGVSLVTGERIARAEATRIDLLSGKTIPYDLLLWTGGVAPNPLMNTLGFKKDQAGQRVITTEEMLCIPESEELRITSHIFGIGDAVCFIHPKTGKPVPGVARAAMRQAWVVAHNIEQLLLAQQDKIHTVTLKRYHPLRYPYILPVGGKFAIAQFGPIVYSGILAWITKGIVEFNYLLSIFTPRRALRYWLKGLWIFLRNDKL